MLSTHRLGGVSRSRFAANQKRCLLFPAAATDSLVLHGEERQADTRAKLASLASLASLTPRQPTRRLLGYSFILSSLRHHRPHRRQRRLRPARKLCYTAKDAIRSHTKVASFEIRVALPNRPSQVILAVNPTPAPVLGVRC